MNYRVINREVGVNTPDIVSREFPNLHDAIEFSKALMGLIMDGSGKHEVVRIQIKHNNGWVTFANFSFNYDDLVSIKDQIDYANSEDFSCMD